jgi:dsRNA-specific ribonuclease
LESLETLGDSFLKYAASQQLFKLYQNHHEGLLSMKKEKIISNAALCRRGCDHKLPVVFPSRKKVQMILPDQQKYLALRKKFHGSFD